MPVSLIRQISMDYNIHLSREQMEEEELDIGQLFLAHNNFAMLV
jgi:hypothetical protein